MKCYIVRDLLPRYLDGLTGEEATGEIKAHLDTCEDCRTIYEQMAADIPQELSPKEKKIDFFKKLTGWLAYEVLQNGQQLIMIEEETEAGMSVEPQVVLSWMTQEGLTRMLLVGLIGTAVFLIWGIVGMRRKEI